MGYIKGKSALHVAKEFERSKYATGHKLWARGYIVSTVGRDEKVIREYIQNQKAEDKRIDQMVLFYARAVVGRLRPAGRKVSTTSFLITCAGIKIAWIVKNLFVKKQWKSSLKTFYMSLHRPQT